MIVQHQSPYSDAHESNKMEYSIPNLMLADNQDIGSSLPQAGGFLSREFVARRISEGETGRLKEELKCEACGKGYKHISSLAKHLWEHTPEWSVTSKFLISKHQQVQLLEAASILVSMNEEDNNSEEQNRESSSDDKSKSITESSDSSPSPPPTIASPGIPMVLSTRPISKQHSSHPSSNHYIRRSSLSHPPSHHRISSFSSSSPSSSLLLSKSPITDSIQDTLILSSSPATMSSSLATVKAEFGDLDVPLASPNRSRRFSHLRSQAPAIKFEPASANGGAHEVIEDDVKSDSPDDVFGEMDED